MVAAPQCRLPLERALRRPWSLDEAPHCSIFGLAPAGLQEDHVIHMVKSKQQQPQGGTRCRRGLPRHKLCGCWASTGLPACIAHQPS